MNKITVCFLVLFLCACANTKNEILVDGSSAQSTQNSLQKIDKALSKKQRIDLLMALLAIQLDNAKATDFIANAGADGNKKVGMEYGPLGSKIDGLNYYQILELAKQSSTRVSRQ
ncbi:DUF6694 family lipoprotein [uncultured Alteromonas sp.]|uniref:DUF6694 family lipoprotein n=1 Tax=uncultured Alteromonas sp. TaxID=179113 RepID=UPI0025E800D8|nr:DUF6694 family lipoprotein [uncultured Alteromonas sp.]